MNAQHTGNDILSGLNPTFVTKIKSLGKEIRFADGSVIIRQGAPARCFFTLVDGKVSLCLGKKGHAIYRVDHSGEAFGWSSLTGCNVYTASAVSGKESKVLKIDGNKLRALLNEQPNESLKFYQNLSRMLDNRLHQSYDLLTTIAQSRTIAEAGEVRTEPFELL